MKRFFSVQSFFGTLRSFSFREKLFASLVFLLVALASGYWVLLLLRNYTIEVPDYGGKYQEGAVGQPLFVNPLLSPGNPVDSDLVRLIYSGLLRYDIDGKIVNDLAQDVRISEDGKEYTIVLRSGLVWHDGEPITIDDILFTFEILQNPAYWSPLRQKWPVGVVMERQDDLSARIILTEPYSGFLDDLTVGILPKHVWGQTHPDRFSLSVYNLEPIGSGPYRFSSLQKTSQGDILSYTMKAFPEYFSGEPYISEFSVWYYPSEEEMIAAYKAKKIKGMRKLEKVSSEILGETEKSTNIYRFFSPLYYGVFLNQTKSKALAYDPVRQALALAVDRTALIQVSVGGEGVAVQAPFLPGEGAYRDDMMQKTPNVSEAENILESSGWIRGEDGVRVRDGNRLEFSLITADWGSLPILAETLKNQWERIGVRVNVSVLETYDLGQNRIRPKEYEALLYVQSPGSNANLFSYWHSSQKDGDGLNLSLFSNKTADEILEKIKITTNQEDRDRLYGEFQNIFLEKNPALYLFSPIEYYPVSKSVFGVQEGRVSEYSDRFSLVSRWYIDTKRQWKSFEKEE